MRERALHALLICLALSGCGDIVPLCLAGSHACEHTCANLMQDQDNCGACGNACGAGLTCQAGVCTASCAAGLTACGDTCRDTHVDADNCGACGTVCDPTQSCTAGTCSLLDWELVANPGTYVSYPDTTPADATNTFTITGTVLHSLAFPTSTAPTGAYTLLAPSPLTIARYSSLAWSGSALYAIQTTSVLKYDISTNVWTTPVAATLTHSANNEQVSASDDGIVYAWSSSHYLVAFNTADSSVSYIMGPADLPTLEPRLAWDSATKRLYLGDYDDATAKFYAFNPIDGSFTALTALPRPDTQVFSDGFCSDRKGHLFTSIASDDASHEVWMYTAATAVWSRTVRLPWNFSAVGACAVTGDGHLYWANGSGPVGNDVVRLDLDHYLGAAGAQ